MQQSPMPFHEFQPTNGESYSDLQGRVGKFFDMLLSKHKDDSILLVSHTGSLTMLLLKILNKPITRENYDKYKPGNTAVTVCEIIERRSPLIHALNDVGHLKK